MGQRESKEDHMTEQHGHHPGEGFPHAQTPAYGSGRAVWGPTIPDQPNVHAIQPADASEEAGLIDPADTDGDVTEADTRVAPELLQDPTVQKHPATGDSDSGLVTSEKKDDDDNMESV